MKHRHILLLLALLATVATTRAQDRWAAIADSLLRFAPTSVYLFNDSVRQWLLDYEQAEGYAACYQRFYDTMRQNVGRARQQGDDDAVREITLCCLYMSWQQGGIDTDEAYGQIRQLVSDDCKEHGDTTAQHVRLVAIMANFLSEAGRYAEAERWCLHIDTLMQRHVTVYIWHNSMKLQALLAAQVGQGRLIEAWQTARTLADRYLNEVQYMMYNIYLEEEGYGLKRQTPSPASLAIMAKLAPRLLLPLLPPPPAAFAREAMAPWPLSQTQHTTSLRRLQALVIFSLHDLLFRAGLSPDFSNTISKKADGVSIMIADYSCTDSIAPPLSAELCRRTAMMATVAAEQSDTLRYPHNHEHTLVMTRWMRCMAMEQLNYDGERSAVSLLRFAGDWIKKGYPLSMLPLVSEAVTAMQRELGNERPTQRGIILAAQDREWLRTEWPAFEQRLTLVHEYERALAALRQLAASQQGR